MHKGFDVHGRNPGRRVKIELDWAELLLRLKRYRDYREGCKRLNRWRAGRELAHLLRG